MSDEVRIQLTVNGQAHQLSVPPRLLLSDALRERLGLTGTHVGCEHGVCGACTVEVDGRPTRSCLLFAVQVDGQAVDTIEGVATDGALDTVQQAFVDEHGLQCGFCTPGFVISTRALLREVPDPDDDQITEMLGGHVCRCTGYQNIVRAVRAAVAARRTGVDA